MKARIRSNRHHQQQLNVLQQTVFFSLQSSDSIASSIHCVFVIFWLILFFRHAIQNEIYSGGLNKNSPHLFIWWGYGQLVKYINNGSRRTHIAHNTHKKNNKTNNFFRSVFSSFSLSSLSEYFVWNAVSSSTYTASSWMLQFFNQKKVKNTFNESDFCSN